MDLPSQSVRALFGQNCFHHFPDPEKFFQEARRVIKPGGGIVLIDPYYGPVSNIVYKRLFTTETFDKAAPEWNELSLDPQAKPNQALSYIVFVRDRAKFISKFPEFEILLMQPLPSYLRYVLSGGLNFRQLAPDSFIPLLKTMEKLMRPLAPLLALHHVIVLRRN
jgi:SAM-dependent methyltransferase